MVSDFLDEGWENALVTANQRHDVIAVPLGQGHSVGHYASREGETRGVNVIDAFA